MVDLVEVNIYENSPAGFEAADHKALVFVGRIASDG